MDPLMERLLPPEDSDKPYVDVQSRVQKDKIFQQFYLLNCFLVLFIALFRASWTLNPSPIAKAVYETIVQSAGLLTLLIFCSVCASFLWLMIVNKFTKPMLQLIATVLPIFIFTLSLYTLLNHSIQGESQMLLTVSISGLVISSVSFYLLLSQLKLVNQFSSIVRLSLDVLQINPQLFLLGGCLTLVHLLFSSLWLWLVSILFAHDREYPSFVLLSYFMIFYFWTSKIFQNLETTVVSSVVGEWYFDRFSKPSKDVTWMHLKAVTEKSFGQIVIASLVTGLLSFFKFTVHKMQQYTILKQFATSMSAFVESFSSYTLVYVGLTGESFLESSAQTTKLFRRNLVFGLATHFLSKLLHFLGKIFVSGIVGSIIFWIRVKNPIPDATGYEWLISLIAFAIPYYVVSIITHVLETTQDAMFICYVLDLDTNSCHSEGAHQTFAPLLK
ncbi:plasma-membrane choline transporter-domain-containing protein [Gorgonomyces haynaldii]|nr:plasma-membrane choline transporter-domain-containing protein [Gorgonomyces haynaldii]